jgi:hypothetical protein
MKQMMKKQNGYSDEWRSLGYPIDMGSSSFLRPPPSDFIRAYHMMSSEHAISDIKQGHMKVARFTDANDRILVLYGKLDAGHHHQHPGQLLPAQGKAQGRTDPTRGTNRITMRAGEFSIPTKGEIWVPLDTMLFEPLDPFVSGLAADAVPAA